MTIAERLQSKRADTRFQARKEMRMIEMLREELGERTIFRDPAPVGLSRWERRLRRPLTQALDAPWWIQ